LSAAHDPRPASADTPRPEHPRPDFLRTDWINLNGPWEFAFDPGNVGEYHGWFRPGSRHFNRRITVPFCWESRLSGLAASGYRGAGWYRRTIEMYWADRLWLRREVELPDRPDRVRLRISHDKDAVVYVNGRPVFEARLPPEAVAQFLPGRNVIAVHCRQTEGGQYIDVGLRYSLPRPTMV
jgi:hypothetical protein